MYEYYVLVEELVACTSYVLVVCIYYLYVLAMY